jgi:hypothetical protein
MDDPPDYSFVIPAKNEAVVLQSTVSSILEWAARRNSAVEIVVVVNGSSDGTADIAAQLAAAGHITAKESKPGLGNALRVGIAHSTGALVVLTGADLPFGFTDVDGWSGLSPAVGSKSHPDSRCDRSITRRLASGAFQWTQKRLTPLPIGDTQGSLLIPGALARAYGSRTTAEGFGFSTELLLSLHKDGFTIAELPVHLHRDERPTQVNLLRDGLTMTAGLVKLRRRQPASPPSERSRHVPA